MLIMPRIRRMLSDSNIYHVMARGNEKRSIFLDNNDREKFLSIISKYSKEKSFTILAFCLMDTHFHFLIDEGIAGISLAMKLINTSYAVYFNKRHRRIGHLFHDRFKSEAIDCDAYLLAAVRYIHNNPVKAGLVTKPEYYPWSSYVNYLKKMDTTTIVNCAFVLDLFGSPIETAQDAFRTFSNQEADYMFADSFNINKDCTPEEEKVILIVNQFLQQKGLTRESLRLRDNTGTRNELISLIQSNTNLSIRRIAKILDVNKNMIVRAK